MSKQQQFTFTLSGEQVREAVIAYAAKMVNAAQYDIVVDSDHRNVMVTATRKRQRKAKAKPAIVPAPAKEAA